MAFQSEHPIEFAAVNIVASLILSFTWTAHTTLAAGIDSNGHQESRDVELSPAATVDISVRSPAIHTWPIQVDVEMVIVGVTVTDHQGRIITGLNKNNFRVYDEQALQQITSFSAEDAPASVGIIFDSSASMLNKVDRSKAAAVQFFNTSNPDDEFMLIQFNDRPTLLSTFTSKLEALEDRLLLLRAGGRTALLDGIYLGLNEMRRAQSKRKALVVISDGVDNHSRYKEKDIESAVKESDTQIYAIGILEPLAFRWLPGEKSGPALLSRLAKISGGSMFPAQSAADLPEIARKISLQLRNEYIIGYKPSNLVRDGRWRHIRMELIPPNNLASLQVYSRAGYYAPTQ